MNNRVIPDPSSFTRLVSVGRQLRKLGSNVYTVQSNTKAAALLGTTSVRVIGVGIGVSGDIYFTVEEHPRPEDITPRTALVHEMELE